MDEPKYYGFADMSPELRNLLFTIEDCFNDDDFDLESFLLWWLWWIPSHYSPSQYNEIEDRVRESFPKFLDCVNYDNY